MATYRKNYPLTFAESLWFSPGEPPPPVSNLTFATGDWPRWTASTGSWLSMIQWDLPGSRRREAGEVRKFRVFIRLPAHCHITCGRSLYHIPPSKFIATHRQFLSTFSRLQWLFSTSLDIRAWWWLSTCYYPKVLTQSSAGSPKLVHTFVNNSCFTVSITTFKSCIRFCKDPDWHIFSRVSFQRSSFQTNSFSLVCWYLKYSRRVKSIFFKKKSLNV